MFSSNAMSPADIGAIVGNNNDGFCGGASWWFIIVLFCLFGGFNGNGWGGNSRGVQDQYILASDFSALRDNIYQGNDQLQRQITAVANGVSSLGYEQLAQMNQISTNIMQGTNAIQSQLAQCCCDNKSAIADVNYNMATQANGINNAIQSGFCQTNFNNSNNTRDIVDSQNAGTQAILAKLTQMESNAQADKIADLQAENQRLSFCASQQAQNSVLINALRPTPVPSFPASNLYGYYGTTIA